MTDIAPDQHHPRPSMVSVNNTSQVIAGNTSYNLDLALPSSGFQFAKGQIFGPEQSSLAPGKEFVDFTTGLSASDATGHTTRYRSAFSSYSCTYDKALGVTNLSHKLFEVGSRYVALQAAQIIGTTLRLTFRNYGFLARTLWVKGQVNLY